MKEYIIHGTTCKNLEDILNSKYIEANINNKNKGMLDRSQSVNQIFTQLLYRNLPNENIQIPHWLDCALILDKKILKDYPFYATNIGGFLNNFNDAFLNNPKKNIYAKGKGNLLRMPNLKNLKNNIENIMNKNIILKSVQFMHSHEILFNKKISIKKYCKLIVCSIPCDNIVRVANKLKIPVITSVKVGLNNFIDLIENKAE
jgi:hypothetical protein